MSNGVYIAKRYLEEKMPPIENFIKKVKESETGNMTDSFSDYEKESLAFAFAVIAKELGVKIPDV